MQVKAAVCYELHKPLVVDDVEFDSELKDKDVLVHWVATGVCHSDVASVSGYFGFPVPFIPGHEGGGIVEEVGAGVTRVKVGDHVISNLIGCCGKCRFCISGRPTLCEKETTLPDTNTPFRKDGQLIGRYGEHELSTFAEYCVLPETCVEFIREDVPLDVACILGCGALAGASSVFNRARVHFGSRVVVIGCGGLGLAGINAAKICGAVQIIGVDIAPRKLELSKKFGATDVIDASKEDPIERISKLTNGLMADYAFECVGTEGTMQQAIKSVGWDGKVIIMGVPKPGTTLTFDPEQLLFQKIITGTSLGASVPARDIPLLADMYMAGKFMLGDLVSHRMKLEDVNKAFDLVHTSEAIRSVLTF